MENKQNQQCVTYALELVCSRVMPVTADLLRVLPIVSLSNVFTEGWGRVCFFGLVHFSRLDNTNDPTYVQ